MKVTILVLVFCIGCGVGVAATRRHHVVGTEDVATFGPKGWTTLSGAGGGFQIQYPTDFALVSTNSIGIVNLKAADGTGEIVIEATCDADPSGGMFPYTTSTAYLDGRPVARLAYESEGEPVATVFQVNDGGACYEIQAHPRGGDWSDVMSIVSTFRFR